MGRILSGNFNEKQLMPPLNQNPSNASLQPEEEDRVSSKESATPLASKAGNGQTQNALASCPFCGSNQVNLLPARRDEWAVVCHGCHVGTGHSPDARVVIDSWNKRV